jgi:hypothetical protein
MLRVVRVSRKTFGPQKKKEAEDWRKKTMTRNSVICAPHQLGRPVRRTFISRRE